MRLAFMGFRHFHILSLYKAAKRQPEIQIVGACEEDGQGAASVLEGGDVRITHDCFADMLRDVACDAVAVGDYFGKRGQVILQALDAGKHVITDKPVCTRLDELDHIERLAAQKRLCIGCMLESRSNGTMRAMRRLIHQGVIGPVHSLSFNSVHPLFLGKRPHWYFEEGKHGGTINDMAIHSISIIPWLTGLQIVECVAARVWNACGRLPQHPQFQDGAQLMLRLENDGGVLGDVSYLSPDGCGYSTPQYGRITCYGSEGAIESCDGRQVLIVARKADTSFASVPPDPGVADGYLRDFLAEVAGQPQSDGITTAEVLRSTRKTLLIQEAADHHRFNVRL